VVSRRTGYLLLTALAVVMLARLMLDEPATLQDLKAAGHAQQAGQPFRLFPTLRDPAQIEGLEVLNVSARRGILLMRQEDGRWYAPEIAGIQAAVTADAINQVFAENAATAAMVLAAISQYPATEDDLARYGLAPTPAYRIRFRARDSAGHAYEALIDIGNTNPDNVAYYGYAHTEADQHIYLIRKQTVDMILAVLDDPAFVAPVLDESPAETQATSPGP